MQSLPNTKSLFQRAQAHAALASTTSPLERLRSMDPFLIDVSLRENAIGAGVGQTLEEKLYQYSQLKRFGMKRIVLGALNYSLPDELEVDDDFMIHLRDHHHDLTDCYALTSVGSLSATQEFIPDISQRKLMNYKIRNTIHEISVGPSSAHESLSAHFEVLQRRLIGSIVWLQKNLDQTGAQSPRIIVNIVDGSAVFAEHPALMLSVLELLAELPLEGVSFQDGQGSFLPFQIGAFTKAARQLLPPSMKLLVHVHAGAGVENASVIEALLNGADGVWGALSKEGPVSGHASLGELIANLVRIGNPHMKSYRLEMLSELCPSLKDRYCLPLSYFHQNGQHLMDLRPETIGSKHSFKVCPIVSDPAVIAQRLAEVLETSPSGFDQIVLTTMIRLMRQDLRAGIKLYYNEEVQLKHLYERAVNLTQFGESK